MSMIGSGVASQYHTHIEVFLVKYVQSSTVVSILANLRVAQSLQG